MMEDAVAAAAAAAADVEAGDDGDERNCTAS